MFAKPQIQRLGFVAFRFSSVSSHFITSLCSVGEKWVCQNLSAALQPEEKEKASYIFQQNKQDKGPLFKHANQQGARCTQGKAERKDQAVVWFLFLLEAW